MGARRRPHPWLIPAIWAGAAIPVVHLVAGAVMGTLGANAIAEVLNRLGLYALVFLVASLTATPLQALAGWTWPSRVRRTLGLIAFTFASLHFLTYLALDQLFDLRTVVEDVVKRPFILVGLGALVLLVPLAVTSTDRMVRRLGYRRWKALHRLAYAAGVLAATHFVMRVKADLARPALFAVVLLLGFAVRLRASRRKRKAGVAGDLDRSSAP